MVTRGRNAQFRPARLDARPLAAASDWIGGYAQFWDDSLGALDQYLNAPQAARHPDQQTDGRRRPPHPLEKENDHD